MVQSDPEASQGPSARAPHQLWCVREWETSSLLPPCVLSLPNSLRRPFYLTSPRSSRSRRCLHQQAGTGCLGFFFRKTFCSISGLSGSSHETFLPGSLRTPGATVSRPSFPPILPEEWEDCRRGIAETRMCERTKEQKARVLPPKWRKVLCQEHNVSPYWLYFSWICNLEKNLTSALSFWSFVML